MNEIAQSEPNTSAILAWISPRKLRFWVIVLLLFYTLAGFFLAPWLVQRIATQKVSEVGRTLTIGDIRINPFLLTIQLLDTRLEDTDGQLLVSYDEYFWDLQASSLFRWAWTFKEIRLSGLQVNYERFAPGDDRFGRFIDAFPAADEPPAEVSSAGLPRLIIQNLKIEQAAAVVTDHLDHGEFSTQLGPINVEVSDLSTLPNESGLQQVNIKTRAGGEIAWQGSVQLAPLQSIGSVTIDGRVFADLDHYLELFTTAKLSGEDVGVEFDYHLEESGGTIEFRMSDLNVQYHQWSIFLADESEPLITLPDLQIRGASLKWPEQEVDIASVSLSEPVLRLVMEKDGSLNIDRLLADFAEEPAIGAEGADESELPADNADEEEVQDWQIRLASFSIDQAVVQASDMSTEPEAELEINSLAVQVTEISNQPEASLPVQASFALASGGTGTFTGQVVALPEFSASGDLAMTDVQLPVVQPWLNSMARLTLNSGNLAMQGAVTMSPDQPGSYAGSVTIGNMDLTDNLHNERLAGWQQMHIDSLEVDLAANNVRTSIVELEQPFGRLQIAADKSTNLDGLMIESAEVDEPAAEEASSESVQPMAITVAGLDINDAALDFSDLSLPLPFATSIRSMDGTISTLATNSQEPARIQLEGQVNEYGLARIGGSINAWLPSQFSDVQMTFRNLEMERITPYTIEFAGWEIDAGRMDLDLDYKINDGQLLGANKIVIREMTVGDKVENSEGTSLPLKFAVALLKDSDGVIDVDLPVSGDMNDPSFKIGGIVWKAIGNLLVKAVTAPFRLLGSLVGVDSEDFGTLHFAAGQAEVSPPDTEQLVKLAEAMGQRPELRLEVSGSYTGELDGLALRTQSVGQKIEQAMGGSDTGSAEIDAQQAKTVLEQLVLAATPDKDLQAMRQQFSSVPEGSESGQAEPVLDETAYLEALRQNLIEVEPVSEDQLLALADARADAVMALLAVDGEDSVLAVTRLEAAAVEAGENGEVPLELKVEAAK